jgi:hypothetical protein
MYKINYPITFVIRVFLDFDSYHLKKRVGSVYVENI